MSELPIALDAIKAFLRHFGPYLGILLTTYGSLWAWRWNRQRPLSKIAPAQLQAAFYLSDALRRQFQQRGTISYRELNAAVRRNRRIVAAELKRRARSR